VVVEWHWWLADVDADRAMRCQLDGRNRMPQRCVWFEQRASEMPNHHCIKRSRTEGKELVDVHAVLVAQEHKDKPSESTSSNPTIVNLAEDNGFALWLQSVGTPEVDQGRRRTVIPLVLDDEEWGGA
ncbi:hypothetical protein DYB31_012722, partial [Aphanomyces astaci]